MRSTITDRPNYIRAHARYKDLHDLLGNLSTKLTEVSKDVDQEFLSSYRVHMLSIQTEIKNLREDVDRGVMALKSDGNVAKLETEVNWFVEECTRLRLHFTTMENDCKQMQSRYKAMMEQKQYMNQQLKAILKRNRVLEAEIEYALNENQRSNKQEQDIATWSQQQDSAGQEEEVGFGGGEGDLDDEQEGGPMNFYQNHLVRESAKSPLSTTMFVPSPSGKRSSGSREGRVGSRSRSGSPTHPALHTSSTRGDMGEGGQSDNVLRELQGATDVLPILSNQASRLFKGESKPRSAKDNWEKKGEEKKKKMQRSKELLDEFLKHKSPAEAALERSIADVFEEVRSRKLKSAQRGSMKRFPVNFMGKDEPEAQSTRRSFSSKGLSGKSFSGFGKSEKRAKSPPGRTDRLTDLGSVISESDLHSLLAEDEEEEGDFAPRVDEAELMKQPLVQYTGGISGLGVAQLSDNDRFSCLVKFLLQRDRFKEVVGYLREQQ